MKEPGSPSGKNSGIIPVVKPKGITSSDAVLKIKKALSLSKVGHSGTLDPLAQGVLLILVGGATKIVPFIGGWEKEYLATATLGISTDTDDMEGKVISEKSCTLIDRDKIEEALQSFKGEISQLPPVYSAKKFRGKAHYEYARQGVELERSSSVVTIREIELLAYDHPLLQFKVSCSGGTYVRSICRDLGHKLGVGAALKELNRTQNGPFTVKDCIEMDALLDKGEDGRSFIKKLNPDLLGLRQITVNLDADEVLKNGGLIFKDNLAGAKEPFSLRKGEAVSVCTDRDEVLGIFESLIDGEADRNLSPGCQILRARRIFN